MGDPSDLFRREFLGRPVTPKIEDVHPFPWTVRRHVSPDRITRSRYDAVWLILDARSKCVAECESEIAARSIADAMNGAENLRLSVASDERVRGAFATQVRKASP